MKLTRRALAETDTATEGVRVALYRSIDGVARGWFIAPLVRQGAEFVLPFLPMDANKLAAVAVIRALEVAETHTLDVTVHDPDGIWDEVWT